MGASGERDGDMAGSGDEVGAHVAAPAVEADLFAAIEAETAAMAGGTVPMPRRRVAGRPAGTPNRSTTLVRQYMLQAGFSDPLMVLGSLWSADAGELATALGCKKVEAAELIRKAAVEGLPYFHQAMPKAVAVKHEGARPLIIIRDGAPGIVERNQGDSALVIEASHESGSGDAG